jgi:hypothetical protein
MRYRLALPAVAASLAWSALLTQYANAQSNPYPLDRLFLEQDDHTPLYDVLSFNSITEVDNYYGVTSQEATLAKQFFAGYSGSSANMLFTRYPDEPARAHLYGSNVDNLTLAQLQAVKGSLNITSQGYAYSGSVNLAGVTNFSAAASRITAALNKNLPVAAVTSGSSIAPVSLSFTGSINTNVLNVTSISSGSIQIGSVITGNEVAPGVQVSAQLTGTPGGVGQYLLFLHGLSKNYTPIPTESLTESYGVLTVGSASSGTVAVGQQVTDATGGVLPNTAIEANLSGSGAGSRWVVNQAQTVLGENMTMTGAPLQVTYQNIIGATQNTGYFFLQQSQDFLFNSASLTYMGGTAAASLGLTQASGAFLSTPGLIVIPGSGFDCSPGDCISAAQFMNNLVGNENGQWATFQNADFLSIPPGTQAALEAWAETTNGQYDFLEGYTNSTPPIMDSLDSSLERPFLAVRATVPETSTWTMAALGFAALGFTRFRLKRAAWGSIRRTCSTYRTSLDLRLVR